MTTSNTSGHVELEQRAIEQALHEWVSAVDAVDDLIFIHDRALNIIRANRAYAARAGLDYREIVGKPYWEIFPKQDAPFASCLQALDERHSAEEEFRLESGETFAMRAYPVHTPGGEYLYSVHVLRDITQHREAESALEKSEQRYRNLVETTNDWVWEIDQNGAYVYVSPRVRDLLGYEPSEVIGRTPFNLMTPVEAVRVGALFAPIFSARRPFSLLENICLHKDGHAVVLETSGVPEFDASGAFRGYHGIDRDITARKRAEETLRKLNHALKTLSACNAALVHAQDENGLLYEVCQIIVEAGGYFHAWIGYVGDDGHLRTKAQAGGGTCRLEHLPLWLDAQQENRSVADVPRASVVISREPASDPSFAGWHDEIVKFGVAAIATFHLIDNDGLFGALCICAHDRDSFNPEELELLTELSADLNFGIGAQRIRTQRDRAITAEQRGLERLRESLEATITAVAATVEMRDPYTAGHERRVAQLASAIALEMGISQERIEGIHFGALIHDLGKIKIPAELLSKPTALTKAEFELIKEHAQAGYDILKDIQFPWPVAEMARQHHERLDGSGYPRGLKGDEILLESKILAVADTVEAMSSHRPYRPARGIEPALAEIRAHRGIWYEPEAVDACLRLFKDKGFALGNP